jgi:hypothetical protein
MTDIVAFLAERYDEDEQLARDAETDWTPTQPDLPRGTHLVYGLERVGYCLKYQMFASTWEPDRVLADIAAKRAILAAYDTAANDWTHVDQTEGEHAREYALREVVKHLATAYAGHPDYDEAWRP